MTIAQGLIGSSKSTIQFIAGISGSNLSSGVTNVTFSGHQAGDFLLAVAGTQQGIDPTFTDGWNKIVSYTGSSGTAQRTGIIVYKYATSSDNDIVNFTGNGTAAAAYSAGYIFRNVRGVGNSNTVNGTTSTGTSIASPTLTLSDTTTVKSTLVLCSYAPSITAAPNSMNVANSMSYGTLRSSWAGGNFTTSIAVTLNCGIVELLN